MLQVLYKKEKEDSEKNINYGKPSIKDPFDKIWGNTLKKDRS